MAADDTFDALQAREATISTIWAGGAKSGDETKPDIELSSTAAGSVMTVGRVSATGSNQTIFRIRDRTNAKGATWTGANLILSTSSPTPSANAMSIFQLDSTTLAFLPPRMTTAQETTLSAAIVAAGTAMSGAMIFNTTLQKLRVWGDAGVSGFTSQS